GWLAAESRGQRAIGWVDCRRQPVSVEALVASIGEATRNPFILERLKRTTEPLLVGDSRPLQDSVEVCLDEMDRSRCLLVLEDFHDLDEGQSSSLSTASCSP